MVSSKVNIKPPVINRNFQHEKKKIILIEKNSLIRVLQSVSVQRFI